MTKWSRKLDRRRGSPVEWGGQKLFLLAAESSRSNSLVRLFSKSLVLLSTRNICIRNISLFPLLQLVDGNLKFVEILFVALLSNVATDISQSRYLFLSLRDARFVNG